LIRLTLAEIAAATGGTVHDAPDVSMRVSGRSASESTRYLILEMGARHQGDIAYLATLTPPSIGIVLNIGSAHVGEFGSREVIAAAKSELIHALPAAADGGVAILNADDDLVATAHVLGMHTTLIGEALSAAEPVSAARLQVLQCPDGVTIINDAFNANSESMRAGPETLVSLAQ
jgi:UDP-N-acetylmuramoyl-tripeptide--D-alanyl-D-alanine ligase